MQKREWVISLVLFTFIFLTTSFVHAVYVSPGNQLTGRGVDDLNATNETHLECLNQACVPVNNTINGTNVDLCQFTIDCMNATNTSFSRSLRGIRTPPLNLTHLECIGLACTPVNGSGIDLCQGPQDCLNLTRMICVQISCMEVNISEINGTFKSCVISDDCLNLTNTSLGFENQTEINTTNLSGLTEEKPLDDILALPPTLVEANQPRTIIELFLSWFGLA